jgi:hypothetical protein
MKKGGLRRGPKEYPAAKEAWRARGDWQPRVLAEGICPREKADPSLGMTGSLVFKQR